MTDESYPLGAGYGALPCAGTMTGRFDHTKPNGPTLAKATVTITRDELDMLIAYHNKGLAAYGHVNERMVNFLRGLIETSFGERAYTNQGLIAAYPRDYFSQKEAGSEIPEAKDHLP